MSYRTTRKADEAAGAAAAGAAAAGGVAAAHRRPLAAARLGALRPPEAKATLEQALLHNDTSMLMALNIRNAETERLAERVAELTGETKTAAVTRALRERLERLQRERAGHSLADRLDDIACRAAKLPVVDARSADEILGCDENGLHD